MIGGVTEWSPLASWEEVGHPVRRRGPVLVGFRKLEEEGEGVQEGGQKGINEGTEIGVGGQHR